MTQWGWGLGLTYAYAVKLMRIKVRWFGPLREMAGVAEVLREAPEGASVGEVLQGLHGMVGEKLLAASAVAVNQEYAGRDRVLVDGDEVAVLPPVSGGAR